MDFETWWAKQNIPDSKENHSLKLLIEQAYRAGWDNCRDLWGGMSYMETGECWFFIQPK